jgi:hypothetical protein
LLLLTAVLMLGSLVRIGATLPDEAQHGDAGLYIRLAENVATFGVYGVAEERTMTSAPLLSATIATALRFDPRHAGFRETAVLTDHRAVRQVNLLFVLLLHAGSLTTVLLLLGTGRRGAAAALLTVALTHVFLLENPEFTGGSLQELPSAAILAWTTAAAVRALTTTGRSRLVALGALGTFGGLLTLSRAVFLQIFPLFAVLLIVLAVGWTRRERMVALAVVLAGFVVVVGPWLARNALEFGQVGVSDSGGAVLLIRDMKSDLTSYQHRGSWVHFSPDPIRPAVARLLDVDIADFEGDGPLRPLARTVIDPVTGVDVEQTERRSLYNQALALHGGWFDGFVRDGVPAAEAALLADSLASERVKEGLSEDPLRFARTTPLFLYRSMWTLNNIQIGPPQGFTLLRAVLGIMNIPGFLAVLALGFVGLLRRRPLWFALGGLPTGMILVHALATHAIPRYTRPAAGIMRRAVAIAVVLVAGRVAEAFRSRRRGVVGRPSGAAAPTPRS